MIDFELELWQQTPVNEALLKYYLEQDRLAREQDPHYDGWFNRIDEHSDIPLEQLTAGHGNLIALGYLKVDIGARSSGVKYQITPAGKRQFNGAPSDLGDGETDDHAADSAA